MEELKDDLRLLAKLVRGQLELQVHLTMAAHTAGVMQPDTQAMIARDLLRLSAILDGVSDNDFPSDLARLVHATGALRQHRQDPEETSG